MSTMPKLMLLAERGKHHGARDRLFGILHGLRVRAGGLKAEEAPERHGDACGDAVEEREVLRVPGADVAVDREPVPADHGEDQDRNQDAVAREVRELADEARAADVGQRAEPDHDDACNTHFERGEVPLEEHHQIADDRNGDCEVRNDERDAVAEVRNEASGLAEGIGGVAADAAALLAEHAAFGKDVGNGGRTADGDEPGQDGHRADFSELRRHQDDGGSEHVEHHGHRELQTGHLRLFDRFHNGVSGWISFLVLVEKKQTPHCTD